MAGYFFSQHNLSYGQRPYSNHFAGFGPSIPGLYTRPTPSLYNAHAINVTGPMPGFFYSNKPTSTGRSRGGHSGGVSRSREAASSSTRKPRSNATKVRHSASRSSTTTRTNQSGARNFKGTTKSKAAIVRTNHRKGVAFEKKIAAALKDSRSIKPRSVKTQVPTTNRGRHGRADIVARTTSGDKYVIEAKNYRRGNPLTKDNVKQVKGYAKALKAKPVIVASKTTKVPAKVKQYAHRNNVGITKF